MWTTSSFSMMRWMTELGVDHQRTVVRRFVVKVGSSFSSTSSSLHHRRITSSSSSSPFRNHLPSSSLRSPPSSSSSYVYSMSTTTVKERQRRATTFTNNASTGRTTSAGSTSTTKRLYDWYRRAIRYHQHNYQRYYRRYKLWGMILGVLTIGSIIKVLYFKFSRQLRIISNCVFE